MIIFEELVYQEAGRRKLTVSPERISRAEAEFANSSTAPTSTSSICRWRCTARVRFCASGSERSLLIEQLLKTEVEDKSAVSLAEIKAFYDKNPARFEKPESFDFQSISILPPQKPTADAISKNRKRAEEAQRQAQATKSYQEFGLLAEKISEDDFRVNMGDHRSISRDKLPPQFVKAALGMQAGQVSGVIQIVNAFTIFRLNAHNPPAEAESG